MGSFLCCFIIGFKQPQEARRDVPAMTVIRDHGHGLLVIAGQDSNHRSATLRRECDAITDAKLKHRLMGAHLIHKPEALYDAVVQIDEFSFSQMIYVDAVHSVCRNARFYPIPHTKANSARENLQLSSIAKVTCMEQNGSES